eukprot:m.246000 g.246000  ORF g.246000 m.246000 type:complete len:58 (-) comp19481_c0_seq2:24-197(-)
MKCTTSDTGGKRHFAVTAVEKQRKLGLRWLVFKCVEAVHHSPPAAAALPSVSAEYPG